MTPSQAQSGLAFEQDLARAASELDGLRERAEMLVRDLNRQGEPADQKRCLVAVGEIIAARLFLMLAQTGLAPEFQAAAELAPPDEQESPF